MSYINLVITSNANTVRCEKRYPCDLTLGKLKEKLVLVTGCDNREMKIEAFDKDEQSQGMLADDSSRLDALGMKDGTHIHVTDPTMTENALDGGDETVESFAMSKEDYSKRDGTALAWMRKNKLGHFRDVDPEKTKQAEIERQRKEAEEKTLIDSITIGSRCEVRVPSKPTIRGKVSFAGKTKFKPGYWVGVQYDEPVGRNDGTVEGVKYFECPDKHGAFVRAQCITLGDFPQLGIDELDEI